jgi:hypothetical protein
MSYYWPVAVAFVAVVALGAAIGYFALRAYRSERNRSMALFAIGFLVLSAASGLVWLTMWLAGVDPLWCELGATSVSAVGLGTVLVGLRIR